MTAIEIEVQDVPQPFDPCLDHQLVLVRSEAREVEHQCFVSPGQDISGVGRHLIGQGLPARRRLRDLEQQARGEDAHLVEPRKQHGLDPGQFVDRWHLRMMPCGDSPSWAYDGPARLVQSQ